MSFRKFAGRTLAIVCLAISGTVSAQDDSLSWSFAPYVWAANTSIDLTWRDVAVGGGDIYQVKSAEFGDREFVSDYSYDGLVVGFQFQL